MCFVTEKGVPVFCHEVVPTTGEWALLVVWKTIRLLCHDVITAAEA